MSFLQRLTGKPAESTASTTGNTIGETVESLKAERDQLKQAVADRDQTIQELRDQMEEKASDKALEAVTSMGLSPDEEAALPSNTDSVSGREGLKGRERVKASIRDEFEKKGHSDAK